MSHVDPAQPSAAQAARTSISLNPVTVTWAVSTAATLGAGFGLTLSKDQAGAVVTIITALAAIVSGFTARPFYVPGITGAATSGLAAAAAFGLHWQPEQVASASAALGMILGVLTTGSVVPVAAARAGTTATEVQLGRASLPAPPPPRRPRPRKARKPRPPVSAAPTPDEPTAPLPDRQPAPPLFPGEPTQPLT